MQRSVVDVQGNAEAGTALSAGLYWSSVATSAVMLAIGTIASVNPERAAKSYGVPLSGEPADKYMTAAGVRDLAVGAAVLTFALLRDRRALGISLACTSVIAVGDGVIALRNSPDPKRVLPVHWGAAVGCIGLACLLLRAKPGD